MNNHSLFSLRNLLLGIEVDSDPQIQEALQESLISRLTFQKLLETTNFVMVGVVREEANNFNETLNTLEFCSKFRQALTGSQNS